jgi:hypothetical protein
MAKRSNKTLLVVSLACFIAGWILLSGSRTFVYHFATRKGAEVVLSVNDEKFSLLKDLVEICSKGKPYRVEFHPMGGTHVSVRCSICVDDKTTEEAIVSANQLTDDLLSEFARRQSTVPEIVHRAEPIPIVNPWHVALFASGWVIGFLLLGCGLVMGIAHFVLLKRGTPPPLPNQEKSGDSVIFDY